MGFERRKFVSDYDTHRGYKDKLEFILDYIGGTGDRWRIACRLYLGRCFAMKACPNDDFNYEDQLKVLQHVDSDLYQICETVWNDWESYDYTDNDSFENSYKPSLANS